MTCKDVGLSAIHARDFRVLQSKLKSKTFCFDDAVYIHTCMQRKKPPFFHSFDRVFEAGLISLAKHF